MLVFLPAERQRDRHRGRGEGRGRGGLLLSQTRLSGTMSCIICFRDTVPALSSLCSICSGHFMISSKKVLVVEFSAGGLICRNDPAIVESG